MKNFIKYFFTFSVVFLASCEDLLDVEPRQSISTENALTTPDLIRASLYGVYNGLKSQALYGADLLAVADALGDDSRIINRAGGRYVNQGQNVINNHLGGWANYYSDINQINLILKALPGSALSDAEKLTIEGEMKFIRALHYFNLSRIYGYEPKANVGSLDVGSVPLLLEGVDDRPQITFPSRSTSKEVYEQIYKDLNDAILKAPSGGGSNRATKGASHALLARVALYNEDWDLAARSATSAITSGVARFVGNTELIAAWRANQNPESLFEVLFNTRQESLGVNNSLQSAYTTIGSVSEASGLAAARPAVLPPAKGWGAVVPTTGLLTLHSTGDIRRQLYQLGLNRSNAIVEESTKFLGKSGIVYMDNVPVIRISEMYLIRAEANAKLGKLKEAGDDLNLIRKRAGLTEIATFATQKAVLDEMEIQRRLELAFEGHRWFDLKRWRRDVVKTTGTVSFGETRTIAPLPNGEILANKNLVQNPGY